jgi:chemotaxis signal transduction protein
MHAISFSIKGNDFGIEAGYMIGVVKVPEGGVLPGETAEADGLIGSMRFRGAVAPVFDGAVLLTGGGRCEDPGARIMMVNSQGRSMGIKVDSIGGMMEIPADKIAVPSKAILPGGTIKGMVSIGNRRTMLIVNVEELFAAEPGRAGE